MDARRSTAALRSDLEAVEHGLAVVRQVTLREREASLPDKYDRIPAEMPSALRALYETGTWSGAPVYCWDLVAKVSADGHGKAKAAEDALAHMSFRPPPGLAQVAHTTLRAEQSPAVIDSATYSDVVRDAVGGAIQGRRERRAASARKLSAKYRQLRKAWLAGLAAREAGLRQKQRDENLAQDRMLVMATRSASGVGGGMSAKECDTALAEIGAAGGTAGGVTRWGSSLATIPDQDPSYCPRDGGVLMDDPLAEHYAAKNVNPWTRAERLLFLEKFLSHNKNFRRIATFFEHKSVEDVIRFYFENKKPLKLKQLTKESLVKKRATKKNALVELSRMPTEARSIKNNFVGEAAAAIMGGGAQCDGTSENFSSAYSASNGLGPCKASEASLMREAGKGWKPADQQALVFALCRHRIDDDFSSLNIPIVWCRVAYEVRTKSPAQCRQFYAHFKALLGLDEYAPPDFPAAAKSAPKRPRPVVLDASAGDGVAEPLASRRRPNPAPAGNWTAAGSEATTAEAPPAPPASPARAGPLSPAPAPTGSAGAGAVPSTPPALPAGTSPGGTRSSCAPSSVPGQVARPAEAAGLASGARGEQALTAAAPDTPAQTGQGSDHIRAAHVPVSSSPTVPTAGEAPAASATPAAPAAPAASPAAPKGAAPSEGASPSTPTKPDADAKTAGTVAGKVCSADNVPPAPEQTAATPAAEREDDNPSDVKEEDPPLPPSASLPNGGGIPHPVPARGPPDGADVMDVAGNGLGAGASANEIDTEVQDADGVTYVLKAETSVPTTTAEEGSASAAAPVSSASSAAEDAAEGDANGLDDVTRYILDGPETLPNDPVVGSSAADDVAPAAPSVATPAASGEAVPMQTVSVPAPAPAPAGL